MDLGKFFGGIGNFFGDVFNPKKKVVQPVVQQPISRPTAPPIASPNQPNIVAGVQMPQPFSLPGQTPIPQLGGVFAPTPAVKSAQPTIAPQKNLFDHIGDAVRDTANNVGGAIHDFGTNPNNVPRNVIDYIAGINNPLDNASLDYHNIHNGQPTLVPKAAPTNLDEFGNTSMGANLLNKFVATPAVDAASFLTRIPETFATAANVATGNTKGGLETTQNFQNVRNFLSGIVGNKTADTTVNREQQEISTGNYNKGGNPVGDIFDAATNSLGIASLLPVGKLLAPAKEAVEGAGLLKGGVDELPKVIETPREPANPITTSPTTYKEPAITSPNRPAVQAPAPAEIPRAAPTVEPPVIAPAERIATQPVATQPAVVAKPVGGVVESREIPQYVSPVKNNKTASVAGTNSAKYATGDANLDNIVHDSIVAHKGTAGTAAARSEALTNAGITAEQQAKIRNLAVANVDKDTGIISDVGKQQISDVLNGTTASTVSKKVAPVSTVKPPTTTAPATTSELGSISKDAVSKGAIKSDADAAAVGQQVSDAIDKAAIDAGSTWEKISKKLHAANADPKIKTYADAGLTKEEAAVAQKAATEADFVRGRIDPSLKGGGSQDFYAPKQSVDEVGSSQAYDPNLVNELHRDKKGGGIPASEVDHTTTPYNHYIRRYLNAADAGTSRIKGMVEADGEGVATGAKLTPKAEADVHGHIQKMVDAHDEAARLTASGDIAGANKAIDQADKSITDAIKTASNDIPKNVSGRQAIIKNLTDMREAYSQTMMRTLGFSNVVNRVADQAQKATIVLTNKAIPIANKVSGAIVKNAVGADASLSAVGGDARSLARQYSKGTLRNQLNRNFKASVSLAGVGRNPIVKGIAKADAAIRGVGTYITGAGDLSTEAAKLANMKILGDAQEAGITDRVGMEKYLRDNLTSPEYKDAYNRAEGTMAGYIGLPDATVSVDSAAGKVASGLSKHVDNAITTGLTKIGVPNRVARELNDTIMPTLSGFAGATARIGGKALNGLALGLPQINAALKLAKTGMPGATEQAQLMISRSLIDVVSTGGVIAGGALLGSQGHWTGGYPSDPNEQARWAKDGITPDSFEFDAGDKKFYVQPGRILGALAIPLNVAAALSSGQNPADAATETINQFVDNLGGSSIIKHIADVSALLNGNDADKARAAKSLQTSLVPSTGLAGNIANWTDGSKRTADNALDTLKSRIPGARETLPVSVDSRGNPIPNTKQISGGSSIVAVAPNNGASNSQADPVNSEIERLATVTGADGKKLEITPTTSATNATNKNTQTLASALLNDPIYQKADDNGKAGMLKDVLQGTSTKGISTDISPVDQQALLDHKILGDAKAGVWLDDNKNASAYYTADYNNQKASGTLTQADEDITNAKGAKYKAVAAQVDSQQKATYQLKNNYGNTSQSEFKAMLNPKSDTFDTEAAQKLYDYDQARVAAGLPPKYNLAKAEKSGSGGGGSGSKSFAFANLPSSLVGTGSTGSGGSSGYAKDAPLFTPIAALKAPTGTAIPKGRTISVTKGVKV